MPDFLPRIQQLRAVAAVLVLALHSAYLLDSTPLAPLGDLFRRIGYAGVDIFFVISGFIVPYLHARPDHPHRPLGFILRRYARIYAGYLPALAFVVAAYAVAGLPLAGYNWPGTALLLPISLRATPISVAWTLYFELYFYLLYGLLHLLGKRHLKLVLTLYAFTIIAVQPLYAPLGYFANAHWSEGDVHPLPSLVFSPFVLEFLAGVAVFHVTRLALPPRPHRLLLCGFGVLAVAGLLANYALGDGLMLDPSVLARVAMLLPGILLVFVVMARRDLVGTPLQRAPWLLPLGNASYSLYLLHLPLLILLEHALPANSLAPWLRVGVYVAAIIAILAIALAWYHCVERPAASACDAPVQAFRVKRILA